MSSRFEIADSADGQHVAHVRSANGQVTWVTETYPEHRTAEDAIIAHVVDLLKAYQCPAPPRVVYYQLVSGVSAVDAVYERRVIELNLDGTRE